METTHESFPDNGLPAEPPMAAVAGVVHAAAPSRQSLPAKGSCWYCEKPLDSVRRFCGKTCADSFDEEAEYTR
ncbi:MULTISPECIES: hypothetical protein [unclassified Massilia]|uniref:hypothetical protein n=1 Tax=unclassified Massilia TaxID=2609279 RepID=UPI001B828008|nr:hypothetical protein [Massilia sp. ST3]MBQ5948765.1 hypothetical protein [Massilia sp. ST3]